MPLSWENFALCSQMTQLKTQKHTAAGEAGWVKRAVCPEGRPCCALLHAPDPESKAVAWCCVTDLGF